MTSLLSNHKVIDWNSDPKENIAPRKVYSLAVSRDLAFRALLYLHWFYTSSANGYVPKYGDQHRAMIQILDWFYTALAAVTRLPTEVQQLMLDAISCVLQHEPINEFKILDKAKCNEIIDCISTFLKRAEREGDTLWYLERFGEKKAKVIQDPVNLNPRGNYIWGEVQKGTSPSLAAEKYDAVFNDPKNFN